MGPHYQHRHLDRQPSLIKGGQALLFERLCSTPGSPAGGLQTMVESVLRELQRMLNTRLPVAVGESDESTQTIVNYGLPDFSQLNAASGTDRNRLAALIEMKIAGFEPRLREIRVVLEPDPLNARSLVGTLHAVMRLASISEPVWFPLAVGSTGVVIEQSDYARR